MASLLLKAGDQLSAKPNGGGKRSKGERMAEEKRVRLETFSAWCQDQKYEKFMTCRCGRLGPYIG